MKRSTGKKTALIATAIGLVMAALILAGRGFFSLTSPADIYTALCDAFFVPGILMICFGLLAYVANDGMFDTLAYAAHSIVTLFTPFRSPEKTQKFYDFKLMKEERRQKPKPWLLLVGAGFLVVAGICLLLYTLQC